ncbi:MAG: radical SAM protein [Clostridia bacterium]|nr:radical SAM protein [Clostridia bacterium]
MNHINIPVFIPHLGCPNQCIFCNQRYISGAEKFEENNVKNIIESVLSTVRENTECEIAFFGGSFTGIDRALMVKLLDIAQGYVNDGRVTGIRMSTRPDYINKDIISILKKYSVSIVELGIQSMNNDVLDYLKRGHTSEDTVRAAELLNKANIPFVGQMMIGLPTASSEDEIYCAEQICKLGAVASRIYPTVVFNNTALKDVTLKGEYTPLSVEEAVNRSSDVLDVFLKHGVECIRIGLCESDNLHSDDTYFAGPNHPSIGEMVKSALYLKRIEACLDGKKGENILLICPKGATSQVIGNKRKNTDYLRQKYGFKKIHVIEDERLKSFDIEIKAKEDGRCI